MFELGMSHYPTKLGYVFYRNTFGIACKSFGTQTVVQLIKDKLSSFLKQNDNNNKNHKLSLRALVFEAATDTHISVDGLYTLIRYDPIASLPESST
jgi:hypothetical protein